MNQNHLILLLLLTTMLLVGCSDDRAVAISREAADRQAAQNLEMSQHNREVAAAHHQLADVQEDVQQERASLSYGWNDLEKERQQIARDRRTQSLLTVLTPFLGTVAVLVAAFYFAGRLLSDARSPDAVDAALCELLVSELAADIEPADVNMQPPRLIDLRAQIGQHPENGDHLGQERATQTRPRPDRRRRGRIERVALFNYQPTAVRVNSSSNRGTAGNASCFG